MDYVKTTLKEEIAVKKLVTVHYFEFAKDYVFEGEKHDFWELLYVDKGEVDIMADDQGYRLKQGEMVFHKPNEFHNVWANGRVAPNIVVMSFDCKSKAISYFENKIISIGDSEKNLMAQIIREARAAFTNRLDVSSMVKLDRRSSSAFGCEQLIKLYLEQMLISLVRKGTSIKSESRLSFAAKERSDEDMVNKIISYMNDNITQNLTFDDICRFSKLGKTNLKKLFKERIGSSIMEYFKALKIEEAKKLIREENYNFTEVSDRLGYASIHYFSRHFKKVTNMTPSQYASSVKVKI